MTVYTCEYEWEAMLTCIYVAWASRKGHSNIRLEREPIGQYSLFDEYIHVEADPEKARKVADSMINKLSLYFYNEMVTCGMAYEEDALDNIYRTMILGFAYGPGILQALQYKDIMRNREISKRVGKEICRFTEFSRFHQIGQAYVAHIEPKSKLVAGLGFHFSDRMPSEHWMIVDDVHREALIHPKNESCYIQKLNEEQFERLLLTEQENDVFTDMWKVFFNSIAIKERYNPECQRTLYPIWTRKHAVEFTT